MITSSTSAAEMPARSIAALMAMVPRSCAATEDSAPLNEPTGVRAAETMTTSVMVVSLPENCPCEHHGKSKRLRHSRIWRSGGGWTILNARARGMPAEER